MGVPTFISKPLSAGLGALKNRYTDDDDTISWTNLGKDALVASTAYAALNPNDSETIGNFMGTNQQGPVGYMGGIPNYTATRELLPNAFAQTNTDPTTGEVTARRPGSAGRQYFTDTTFAPDTNEPIMGKTAVEIAADNQQTLENQAIYESLIGDAFDTRVANEATEAATAAETAQVASAFANIPVDGDYSALETQQVIDALNAGTITTLQAATHFGVDESVVINFMATQGYGEGGDSGDVVTPTLTPTPTPTPTPDVVNTITAANAEELDTFGTLPNLKTVEDIEALKAGITAEKWDAGDVAEQFNLPEIDVLEELLRTGFYGYEDNAIADAAAGAAMEEEELVVQLLRANKTNFAEVAEYYQDRYPGITAAQVEANYNNTKFAQGGNVNGYYLGGPTDGMADQIPATIDNSQPAALSDGEFVIPADVVSHLGNGNSDSGAQNLYSMMERVRTDRTGNPEQGRQIDPNKYLA